MAIFGAGSTWNGDEQKDKLFFPNEIFVIGWDYSQAEDLYGIIGSVKVGDIIYLKSKGPKSSKMTIKGIGIVTKPFIHYVLQNDQEPSVIADGESLTIGMKWVKTDIFEINITEESGKLTSIRPSTFYEEFLPSVSNEIINHLTRQ